MGNVAKFVRLDMLSVKPVVLKWQNSIFLIGMMVVMFLISEGILMGLLISVMMGSAYAGFLFRGKKDNLCVSLAIDRKTVVIGRYVSTCIVIFLFSLLIYSLGLLLVPISSDRWTTLECECCYAASFGQIITMFLAIFAVQVIIQAITLPIKFMGDGIAKILSIALPALVFLGFNRFSELPVISDVLASASGRIAIAAVAALVVVAFYVSYRVALVLYNRREF